MADTRYWKRWYQVPRPKAVRGGIRPKNKKGAFAETWWGQRWLDTLEAFEIGERLSRGKTYARKGQVLDIVLERGLVRGEVQGSRTRPYKVTMAFKQWEPKVWDDVFEIISTQAVISAGLLSGELPEELEVALQEKGINLFPRAYEDMETRCTCPDWSNPCKHIAAVAYLLASELDRDPFLIFKLRGLEREELLQRLREVNGDPAGNELARDLDFKGQQRESLLSEFSEAPRSRPNLKDFWTLPQLPPVPEKDMKKPPVNASIIKRLGRPPLWRSEQDFERIMEEFYEAFSAWGEDWLSRDKVPS